MKISFGNNYNNFDRNLYHNNGINKNGDIYHRQKTQTITRDQKYSYYYKQNPQTAQHDTLKRTPQNYGYNRQKNLNYPSKSPEIRYIYGPYPNSNLYPANKNVSKNIKKIL